MNKSDQNIYTYTKPEEILRDSYEQRHKKNPSFSIRAWANKLGMKSHNPLYEMIQGKRQIPKSIVPALIKDLQLEPREAQYFETIVDIQRSKSIDEKAHYIERLKKIRPQNNMKVIEVENYKFYEDPQHAMLVEYINQKNAKSDTKWLQAKFPKQNLLSHIETMKERVIALGLLEEDINGQLKRSHAFTTNKIDMPHRAIRAFHSQVLDLAKEAIEKQTVDQREFNTYFFNIKKADVPRAKRRMREMLDAFLKEFEAEAGMADQTYSVQFHLFKSEK